MPESSFQPAGCPERAPLSSNQPMAGFGAVGTSTSVPITVIKLRTDSRACSSSWTVARNESRIPPTRLELVAAATSHESSDTPIEAFVRASNRVIPGIFSFICILLIHRAESEWIHPLRNADNGEHNGNSDDVLAEQRKCFYEPHVF